MTRPVRLMKLKFLTERFFAKYNLRNIFIVTGRLLNSAGSIAREAESVTLMEEYQLQEQKVKCHREYSILRER
jgi:hypothetical protein